MVKGFFSIFGGVHCFDYKWKRIKSNSSAIKLDPTASQSFPLHMQLRLSLMAERHIQIFKNSLLQVNLRILLLNICAWLYKK